MNIVMEFGTTIWLKPLIQPEKAQLRTRFKPIRVRVVVVVVMAFQMLQEISAMPIWLKVVFCSAISKTDLLNFYLMSA